jgi:HPt (histidine-containing phosphotransfer) domain-containing protein
MPYLNAKRPDCAARDCVIVSGKMSEVTRNFANPNAVPMSSASSSIDHAVLDTANPVDLSHLRRYTMGNVALENEVLGLFLQQLPQTISALKSAKTAHDWRFSTHALKGSSRAVGAWPLAQLAAQAEKLCPSREDRECHHVVLHIEQAADDVRRFVATLSPPSK